MKINRSLAACLTIALLFISVDKSLSTTKGRNTAIKFVQEYPFRNIANSIGLVIPNEKNDEKKALKLYSSDGKIWKSVAFEGPLLKNMDLIFPFAKKEDYYLLSFDCLENKNGYYKVVVNEDTKKVKYIKTDDNAFAYVSWQSYILKMFAVGFQPTNNPLKLKPSSDSNTIKYNKDEIYMPVKFQNDWLEVKWGDEKKWNYGWVQWKKGNLLILELFPIN